MQRRMKILVLGSAAMDLYLNTCKLPEPGQSMRDDGGAVYTPGGRGAAVAVAIARLGEEVTFCTKLGADMHGQKLYNYYKDSGIDTSYIKVDHDKPTGLAVMIREGEGDPREIIYSGASAQITTEAITEAFGCSPDALFISLELPFATVLTAAKIAASRAIPIFVEATSPDPTAELENLPQVEVLMVNEKQAKEYTDITPSGMEASLRAALALGRKIKSHSIVIKLGARGAFIYDGKRYTTSPVIRAGKTVDESGAGCAFAAALITEYLYNGGEIKGAVKYGCAAGAIAVTRPGGAVSAPTAMEIEDLLAEQKP